MAKLAVNLITGRSTKQGIGISTGKAGSEYREATGTIELSLQDMVRAGFSDGDRVTLKSEFGSTEAKCVPADIPEGLAFMAFGASCNQLIGSETHASGMPDSKHIQVEIHLAAEEPKTQGNPE